MAEATSLDSPLRVALVTGVLELGGAVTFLCNLGGELARRKIPVEVFCFESDNPLASDFKRLNVPVFTQDARRLIFEDRLQVILNRLREFEPTVVLANLSATAFEVLRYMPAKVFRVGVAHSDDPKVYEMIGHYVPHLDMVAAVSRTIRERMEALPALAPASVRYLPLGVPLPEAEGWTARQFSGPLRILYLGRLDREQKRVHLFPAILDRLKASGIPFHWTLAGEGAERAALEQQMKGASLAQTVSFAGKVSYVQVPELLSRHDVFLLASDYEGLPLSMVEAMGAGLVPVVSDLPSGIRELVDEKTGKRVATENVAGYAEAIVWLHKHREEMGRMSAEARARVVGEFSTSAMAERWLGAFPNVAPPGIVWPQQWPIQPPLQMRNHLRFSGPGRVLRRMAFRFRK